MELKFLSDCRTVANIFLFETAFCWFSLELIELNETLGSDHVTDSRWRFCYSLQPNHLAYFLRLLMPKGAISLVWGKESWKMSRKVGVEIWKNRSEWVPCVAINHSFCVQPLNFNQIRRGRGGSRNASWWIIHPFPRRYKMGCRQNWNLHHLPHHLLKRASLPLRLDTFSKY